MINPIDVKAAWTHVSLVFEKTVEVLKGSK